MNLLLALLLALGGASVELRTDKEDFWLHNYGYEDEHCWVELTTRGIEVFMPAGTSSRRWRVSSFIDWGCY